MARKKVLVLDSGSIFEAVRNYIGKHELKITSGEDLGNFDDYAFDSSLGIQLQEFGCLGCQTFDFIVIGNNQGVGLAKVAALLPELRAKTVIVSNDPLQLDIARAYLALGITRTMLRIDFEQNVERELEVR